MKLLLTVTASLLLVQVSAFANQNCKTAEGISLAIVEDYDRLKDCEINTIVIGGKSVGTADADGCSALSQFTGKDGSKLVISNNGVGTYVYDNGKIVGINCNRVK